MKNYYQILGIRPTATEAEIKRVYRVLAKRYHPDVNPGDESAASKFADINEAYTVMSDPKARAEYDQKLAEASAPRPSREDIIARQRAQAQAAARQAAYRNMNMNNMTARQRAQAQAQAQAAAQAQAQAQAAQHVHIHAQSQAQAAQVQALCNQAFANGRDQGIAEAKRAAEAEIARINANLQSALAENKKLKLKRDKEEALEAKIKEAEHDRRDLEQELYARDRELATAQSRIAELEKQLNEQGALGVTAKKARAESASLRSDLASARAEIKTIKLAQTKLEHENSELQALKAKLEQDLKQSELKNAAQLQLQQEKRKQLQDEIEELKRKLGEAAEESENLRAENEQWLQYAQSEEFLSDTEQRIEAWTKKTNADKRLAKGTLYADLGLLIWATEQEIKDAYAKLVKKYTGKTNKTNTAIVEKLQKVETAYAVLSDPEKRREYNATLNITDERIAEEQRLIAENDSLMEEYRNRLANKEFWMHFDELTAAAMEGDAQSQYELGDLYRAGDQVEADLEQAVYWFKEAAKQKHADAMYKLGLCYINGEGMEKNEETGNSFIRQAAKLGSKPAQKMVNKRPAAAAGTGTGATTSAAKSTAAGASTAKSTTEAAGAATGADGE